MRETNQKLWGICTIAGIGFSLVVALLLIVGVLPNELPMFAYQEPGGTVVDVRLDTAMFILFLLALTISMQQELGSKVKFAVSAIAIGFVWLRMFSGIQPGVEVDINFLGTGALIVVLLIIYVATKPSGRAYLMCPLIGWLCAFLVDISYTVESVLGIVSMPVPTVIGGAEIHDSLFGGWLVGVGAMVVIWYLTVWRAQRRSGMPRKRVT